MIDIIHQFKSHNCYSDKEQHDRKKMKGEINDLKISIDNVNFELREIKKCCWNL